jgi:hypothetical protein
MKKTRVTLEEEEEEEENNSRSLQRVSLLVLTREMTPLPY